jgi:hypothetical protein
MDATRDSRAPAFCAELAGLYPDTPTGQPPTPPAQPGWATIPPADAGAADDEVLKATVLDRRGVHGPRDRAGVEDDAGRGSGLIEHDMDRRLVERTVAL